MQISKVLDKIMFLKCKLDYLWSSTSMTPSPKNAFKTAENMGSVLFPMISLSSYSKKKFKVLLLLGLFSKFRLSFEIKTWKTEIQKFIHKDIVPSFSII